MTSVYEAVLERVHEWTPGTRSLFLRVPGDARFQFRPGQFVSLELPVGVGAAPPLLRAYSIASSPAEPLLELCVDLVPEGPGSTYLFAIRSGARLMLRGPFGSFCLDDPPPAPLVFITAGTGIAPIRPMVRRALERGGAHPVHLLYGARTSAALLYRDELEQAGRRHDRLQWEPVLGAEVWPTLMRLVEERYIRGDGQRHRHFWVCGVGAGVLCVRDALRAAGYARRAVRAERW